MNDDDIVLIMLNDQGISYLKWYDTWEGFLSKEEPSMDNRKEVEEDLDKGLEISLDGELACYTYYITKITEDNPEADTWYPAEYVPFEDIAWFYNTEYRDGVERVLMDMLGIDFKTYLRMSKDTSMPGRVKWTKARNEYLRNRDGDTFGFIDASEWREHYTPEELKPRLQRMGIPMERY